MTQSEYDEALTLRLTELQNETDPEFVFELIDIYLAEAPKMVQAIRDAILKKDFAALKSTAHALKGSSLNLGANKVGEMCLELEKAGRAGESFPPIERLDEVQQEIELLKAWFESYKKK